MLMVSMLWYVEFYELFVLWVGSSGGWKRKSPTAPPTRNPLLWGEGGEGNNYAFSGKREGFGKLLGTSCKEILKKRPSNFY
jgi:hypothetical protein